MEAPVSPAGLHFYFARRPSSERMKAQKTPEKA
jgi:hypothetical protein